LNKRTIKKKQKEREAAVEEQKQAKIPETEESLKEEVKEDVVTLTREEYEQVKAHIESLQKEKDSTVEVAKRLQAEFDNYRKRNAAIHADSVSEGERNVIKNLLGVLDNLDRALLSSQGVDENFVNGVKLVQKGLWDSLAKFGLEEILTEGKFDPELHEAVMQEEVEGMEEGDITGVFQKGYRVKERILRHSMVKVAK